LGRDHGRGGIRVVAGDKVPIVAALSISAAFMLCGLAPLLSYLVDYSFGMCVLATGLVFFVNGATNSQWSPSGWMRSGLETLLIGMTAAGISYAIGYGLKVLMHVSV
jgi:VIT1/CCC1 family predicted Fe2+/Mn2+ transporter